MFKDIRTYIIAGLSFALIIFILRSCSEPGEEKEAKLREQFQIADAINKAEKMEAQARQDSLQKVLIQHTVKDSIERSAFKIENSRLKKQLATRRPQVQVMIDSTPPLKAFIQTQDSIILTQDVRIDSLETSLKFHAKVNQDLIAQEYIEDRIEADMAIQNTRRISELERSVKKKERGKRLAKIFVPVAAAAGLLLGSVL